MLPDTLKSKYRQYKDDTAAVATWLANTAESFGYSSAALGTGANNPTAKSSRPKGKARKQAKQQKAPSATSSSIKASDKSYVLKIKDFVPMAEHIVSTAKAAFEIPSIFASALDRVIWVRKSVSRQLSRSQGRQEDAKHAYFVKILEEVKEIFKPLLNPEALSVAELKSSLPNTKKEQKEGAKSSANIFDFLDVYEPSEAFLNAPDVVLQSTEPKSDETKYTVETDDSVDEALFALVSLLADLFALRDEVSDLWAKYAVDEIDLAAVSVATNTAIELARSLEEEVTPILDKSGGIGILLQTSFLGICKSLGHNWQAKQRPDDDFNYACYELGSTFFFNVQFFAGGFIQGNAPKTLPQYNGAYGWYNEEKSYRPTSNRQKWKQDKTALAEMMADLSYFAEFFKQPVEDELIRGMKLIREKKIPPDRMPLWFNFALQCFLDVLESERERGVGRSFDQMRSTSLFIKKSLSRVPSSSKERQEALRMATMWEFDPITQCREMLYREDLQKPLPAQFKRPLFNFLRRHPLYCGLWVHNMRTEFHRHGVTYSAVPGAVMCVGQLYHALNQEGLLPSELKWDDFEAWRKMQGDNALFVGNCPTSPALYFKNFCMTIGMSTQNWALNKRSNKIKTTQATRREMHFKGWASLTIGQRLNPYVERRALSSEVVSEILKLGRQSQKHHAQVDHGSEEKGKEKAGQGAPKVVPSELVRQLAISIHAEVPDITFDYFALHDVCWDLLQSLRKRFEQHYGAAKIAEMIPQEDKLPHLIGYVFSLAAGALDIDRTTEPNMTMMVGAAEDVIALLLSGRGHCATDAAAAQLDPNESIELDLGNLSLDPWNVGSGKLIDFVMKGIEGSACPMQ